MPYKICLFTKRPPQFCLLCSPAKSAQKAMERKKKVEKKTHSIYNRIYTNKRGGLNKRSSLEYKQYFEPFQIRLAPFLIGLNYCSFKYL